MFHFIPGLLALAAGSLTVDAHTIAGAIALNGQYQGHGIYPSGSSEVDGYIRGPIDNTPVRHMNSEMLTCNQEVTEEAPRYIDVEGGDEIAIYWNKLFPENADDGYIVAKGHQGPLLLYIAPAAGDGKGNDWVKIDQTDFYGVENLLSDGSQNVTLPDLASGQYLLRTELIAYHQVGAPQFFLSCIQINYISDGQYTLPEGVAIPGAYSDTESAFLFDMYNENLDDFVPLGPDVYDFGSPIPSNTSAETSVSPMTTVTYGGTESAETSVSPVTTVTYGGTESAGTSDSPVTSVTTVPNTMSTAYISTSLYAMKSDSPSATIYDQAQATSAAGRRCRDKSHHSKSHHRTA